MAFSQLTVLLFSPDDVLFIDVPGVPGEIGCGGIRAVSLWCLAHSGSSESLVVRIAAIAILIAVASGFRPRWSCIPHYYVSFSLNTGLTVPNGGERVAQLVTMLLVPICLADGRTWQWKGVDAGASPAWRGASYAAHSFIRLQLAVIYGWAALAKFGSPGWREGTAFRAIANDPSFGLPTCCRTIFGAALASGWAVAVITWGVIALELLIAISMFGSRRTRMFGLVMVIVLHAGIITLMGLFSFGMIMIASVIIGALGRDESGHQHLAVRHRLGFQGGLHRASRTGSGRLRGRPS
ncbi:HTTM domain-containing protein [Nonomuraea sp. SMC257]|uniref:HTTM domain-containing protein n=1 Tax=Nonomuraea montanisoli TaxID=2741721 RepID=A0A7Y6IAA8_9ACTN|nr:HTTM domain-containing protein [Nonomuraea montanisoli]